MPVLRCSSHSLNYETGLGVSGPVVPATLRDRGQDFRGMKVWYAQKSRDAVTPKGTDLSRTPRSRDRNANKWTGDDRAAGHKREQGNSMGDLSTRGVQGLRTVRTSLRMNAAGIPKSWLARKDRDLSRAPCGVGLDQRSRERITSESCVRAAKILRHSQTGPVRKHEWPVKPGARGPGSRGKPDPLGRTEGKQPRKEKHRAVAPTRGSR